MAEFVAVSLERHGKRRWRRFRDYTFARKITLCGLVLAEIEEAAVSLPFGFFERREQLFPVAILASGGSDSVFIDPKGHWLGGYVPAILRAHPFCLRRRQDDLLVLHVDEASGLVVNNEDDGEPFFEGAEPSEAIQQIRDFLNMLEASRLLTAEACALLRALDLAEPWPMADEQAAESLVWPAPRSGLLRINQSRFAELDGDALTRLNRCGGLRLALLQTLSERHLAVNRVLEKAHEAKRQRLALEAQAYLSEAETDDTLSFVWED